MRKLELDNFILYEYDESSNEHRDVILKIEISDIKKYLGNLKYSISKINQRKEPGKFNMAFIAYYNNYPVGYISISYIEQTYQISYAILPQYRRQNLGALLLEEFSEKMLKYENIEDLILKIQPDNIGSIKVAQLADYNKIDNTTYKRSKM